MYNIIKISDDAPVQYEQMGTKYKFWYLDDDGVRVLFKQGRPNTGENWALMVGPDRKEYLTPTFDTGKCLE